MGFPFLLPAPRLAHGTRIPHPRIVSQPPPLRGTSFQRKEGKVVKTYLPPSCGRGMPEGQGVGRRKKEQSQPLPLRATSFQRREIRECRFPRIVISSGSEKSFSFAIDQEK